MHRYRLIMVLLVLVTALGAANPAAAQCTVAVTSPEGVGSLELPQLHATLTALGVPYVDVTSVAQAQAANASVIIDRYDALNLPPANVTAWLNTGKGYIQLGDWPAYFPNSFINVTAGAPITVSITDPTSPLAAGLPPSWTGRGFWAYLAGSNYIGWTNNAALPDVAHAQYLTNTYTRVVSSELVGTGRAVYIGINVYGSAAGPNDTLLLRNAITWAGACALGPQPIPALGGFGVAALLALIALLGAGLIIARLR